MRPERNNAAEIRIARLTAPQDLRQAKALLAHHCSPFSREPAPGVLQVCAGTEPLALVNFFVEAQGKFLIGEVTVYPSAEPHRDRFAEAFEEIASYLSFIASLEAQAQVMLVFNGLSRPPVVSGFTLSKPTTFHIRDASQLRFLPNIPDEAVEESPLPKEPTNASPAKTGV